VTSTSQTLCVCGACVRATQSQTVTNGPWPNTWPKVEQNVLYDLHFDNALPRFLPLPISTQSPILLVHHLYPLPICYAPPFLLILSHNQFNLSPPVFSTLFSTPRLSLCIPFPSYLSVRPFLSTSFLSSIFLLPVR